MNEKDAPRRLGGLPGYTFVLALYNDQVLTCSFFRSLDPARHIVGM